jgi:uncharacterized membrane-anchored protein
MSTVLFTPDPISPRPPDHPLRSFVSEEMHIRKLPPLTSPARIIQYVMQEGENAAARGADHIRRLMRRHGLGDAEIGRYFVCRIGGFDLVFEAHNEFCTYILVATDRTAPLTATDLAPAFPLEWLAGLPGRIIQATQIAFLAQSAPPPSEADLTRYFHSNNLVSCDLAGGKARLWSDFDLHDDGFGRLLLADRGLRGHEASDLIQRLLEQGHYRNMALLGLPEAQRLTPEITCLEQKLANLTSDIAERRQEDDPLLQEISDLSADLARLVTATRYRMSASRAYAQLSNDRLSSLEILKIPGYQSLTDFTERRLMPATRTCESFSRRLEELSQRASWTSALLRTRVETALERQNRNLLRSMNQRAEAQLRLQHTVEGLSAVAISYYAVGLIGHAAEGIRVLLPSFPAESIGSLSVIPVIAAIWIALRRIRQRLSPREQPRL